MKLLTSERTNRFERERERLERRIEAALQASPAAVSDQQIAAWLAAFARRRPRELERLDLRGLAMRLQREHSELGRYSPDWLRQRLARLQEAIPPAPRPDEPEILVLSSSS